jgi:hypothetical protein
MLGGAAAQDANFVVFRMLTMIPFSAKLPKSKVLGDKMPPMPIASLLGELFDATVLQSQYMKPIANLMTTWTSAEITRFAKLRAQQLAAQKQLMIRAPTS